MNENKYFSHLYEIASGLNKEYSLQAALRQALEKTVHVLKLETGWIWLVQQDNQSVFLAASYNLPPALSKHPERLSGWCFCIEKYLANAFSEARNISEITCSRLKDIRSDTRDLKFHATVPIFVQGEKAGLLNLLSKESQQLTEQQLAMLNTISELIGIAIQRTRLQEKQTYGPQQDQEAFQAVLERIFQPKIDQLLSSLNQVQSHTALQNSTFSELQQAIQLAQDIQEQLSLIVQGLGEESIQTATGQFHYPASPLSQRELEVLVLVKKGFTNKQIADQLFITERTVKFHMSSIFSKLFAETRTEAVNIALRRGLIGL